MIPYSPMMRPPYDPLQEPAVAHSMELDEARRQLLGRDKILYLLMMRNDISYAAFERFEIDLARAALVNTDEGGNVKVTLDS